jgi:hydroxypyruvate isomerase
MQRRQFLGAASLGAAGLVLAQRALGAPPFARPQDAPAAPAKLKGRIHHSVCRWCYGGIELPELCRQAKAMGIESIEILDEPEWTLVKSMGLTCATANGPGSIPKGWNRAEHHDELVARSNELLPKIAAAGLRNMIVFSGNRNGQPDAEGQKQCIAGLRRIAPLAEKLGVTVVLEILNSKVDHGDYQFDHMSYGVGVIDGVASPRVKILYDIYHAQIMEGDVIRTIREHHERIGHFHTGGVPDRHEIDDSQELNYRAVCRAIAETGYQGFVAQEFVPTRDPMTSLREAIAICDV